MADLPGRGAATDPRLWLRAELLRLSARTDRQVGTALRGGPPSPALLHELHRNLRRLVEGLGLWAELASPETAEALAPTVTSLKKTARRVGAIRDFDVVESVLASASRGTEPKDRPVRRVLNHLRQEARAQRRDLRAFLAARRRAGILTRTRVLLARPVPPRTPAGTLRTMATHGRELERKLDRAARRARKNPTVGRLHRWRIRIRKLRQFARLADGFVPERLRRKARTLRIHQERLGKLHDLDLALRALGPGLGKSRVAATLVARRLRAARFAARPARG